MKIREGGSGGPQGSPAAARGKRAAESESPPRAREAADRVQVTGRSAEVQRARTLALQAPEVRQGLVAGLREAISDGRYRVTGAQVLPRLLREQSFEARW